MSLSNLILPLVKKFMSIHPEISLELSSSGSSWDLTGRQSDILLRIGPVPDSSLVSRTIYQGKLMTVASPEYISARGVPKDPDDLANHNCLVFLNLASGREISEWVFHENGIARKFNVSGKLALSDGEVYIEAALDGLGIAHGQDYMFGRHFRGGRLQPVLSSWEGPARPLIALYQRSKELSARVRAFVDFLTAELNRPTQA